MFKKLKLAPKLVLTIGSVLTVILDRKSVV